MENKAQRNSNVELLRIIAMFGIILHHCVVHAQALDYVEGFNRLYSYLLLIFGKVGVTIFIAISSYYLCEKCSTVKQFLRVWTQSLLYYILLLLFSLIVHGQYSFSLVLRQFLPIFGYQNWYVSNFLVFLIFVPFINLIIKQIRSTVYCVLITVVLITITIIAPSIGVQAFYSDILYFISVYFAVLCLKDYDVFKKINRWLYLLFIISGVIILFALQVFAGGPVRWATQNYSIFTNCIGVSMFGLFLSLNVPHNKIVNYIGKHTFGIFLLHTANLLRHDYIWQVIFKSSNYYMSNYYLIWTVLSSLIVFSVGLIVDPGMMLIVECLLKNRYLANLINRLDGLFSINAK